MMGLYLRMVDAAKDTYTVRLYRTYWNEEGGHEATRSGADVDGRGRRVDPLRRGGAVKGQILQHFR